MIALVYIKDIGGIQMQKELEITSEQLATLLWIKALEEYEDGINITLRDKYCNFVDNNSDIEGIDSAEFAKNKDILVSYGLLAEIEDSLEFTKKGNELIETVSNTESEEGVQPYESAKKSFPDFWAIKGFIDDNGDIIQIALATASLLVTIIK